MEVLADFSRRALAQDMITPESDWTDLERALLRVLENLLRSGRVYEEHPEADMPQHICFGRISIEGRCPESLMRVEFIDNTSGCRYGVRLPIWGYGRLTLESLYWRALNMALRIDELIDAPPGLPSCSGDEIRWLST